MENGISITTAARTTGVRLSRLLSWEDAKIITPLLQRRGAKRITRLYTPEAVERIMKVKALLDAGYTLRRAAAMLDTETPAGSV